MTWTAAKRSKCSPGFFEEEVSSAGKDPSELPVKRYLAPDVAVVSAPGPAASEEAVEESEEEAEEAAPPGHVASPPHLAGADLVDSTVPLQVEGAGGQLQPVDLALEQEGGELEPASPLVDTSIPSELGSGVELLNGKIGLSFPAAVQERSPSLVEESLAFYPNVEPDTDLAVVPTLTGVETFTQLRSADAPTSQRIALDLPAGATLRATEAGGAEAVKDGELLLSVLPPTAIDANGEPVATTLEVEGEAIVLKVHPSDSAAMPILLDPLFQTYEWNAKGTTAGICSTSTGTEGSSSSCQNREEWGYDVVSHYSPAHMEAGSHDLWSSTYTPGMSVRAESAQTAGDRASVVYTVPRFFKDETLPTSYISHLTLSNLDWMGYGAYPSPYIFAGIWDPVTGGWVSNWTHTGQAEHGVHEPTYRYEFANPTNTNAKAAGIILSAQESTPSSSARAYVGYASVELADQDVPTSPIPKAETKWVDQAAPALSFSATDTGLGVKSITAATEGVGTDGKPLHSWSASYGCIGVGDSACPRTWSSTATGHQALEYQPSLMPTGIDYLSLVAEDPVGNRSGSSFAQVRVDHKAPGLSLSGTLTEQGTLGTKLTEYTLNYNAADGDDAPAVAETPFALPAGAAKVSAKDPRDVAVDVNGNVWVVDRQFRRVIEFDPTGKTLSEFIIAGAVEPSGIAVNGAGNLWVADPGAKRVQLFKPSGELIRTITNAQFNSPYAVATGPSETLWVTDIGGHNIYRFREDGTYLGQVSNIPSGLSAYSAVAADTDVSGDLWVAEQTTNKVLEFSPTGQYLFSFGASGSADGQLNAPNGLAIAPSGNILVSDTLNNRIEVFNPEGIYLRKFGTTGTGSANLSTPRGLAVGPGNVAYIGDAGNYRIARWSHADQDPQSGVSKVEIRVDGAPARTEAPGCATKNCAINGSWTLDADEYIAGSHKVEVIATDAVGRATTKALNIVTHGDYTAPTITLSGAMTEQATLGTTRPSYLLKVSATDPAAAPKTGERTSGVASTKVKVDGTTVDSTSPGCPAEGCSITREWTLNSGSYSAGSHTLQVEATDAAGHVSTKTLPITIERDTAAPQFEAMSTFYTAPEGWVEQKSYAYGVTATDGNGYGVTSLSLKIDGNSIKTTTQTCSAGGCSVAFSPESILNVAAYEGGVHSAELVASDGAGNIRKRTWTMKVDPEGQVTVPELSATLEAVETTTNLNLVAESQSESIEGTSSGLGVEATSEGIEATVSQAGFHGDPETRIPTWKKGTPKPCHDRRNTPMSCSIAVPGWSSTPAAPSPT